MSPFVKLSSVLKVVEGKSVIMSLDVVFGADVNKTLVDASVDSCVVTTLTGVEYFSVVEITVSVVVEGFVVVAIVFIVVEGSVGTFVVVIVSMVVGFMDLLVVTIGVFVVWSAVVLVIDILVGPSVVLKSFEVVGGEVTRFNSDIRVERVRLRSELSVVAVGSLTGLRVVEACAAKV